jgi:hypothetical protein
MSEDARAARVATGRYAFTGSGLDVLALELVNALLVLVTCGLADLLQIPSHRRQRWFAEHVVRGGQALRYHGTWTEMLGLVLVSVLLQLVTCGLAWPWLVVMRLEYAAKHTTTADGARLRFDGSGIEVLGLFLASAFLLVLSLGLAWPWVAVMWESWGARHTIVEDAGAAGGHYRLRFDAGGLSYLVQGLLSFLLILVTLGLYLPWAIANYHRWVWSSMSDSISPPVAVPLGPQTPAQWVAAVAAGAGALLLMVGIGSAVLSSTDHGAAFVEDGVGTRSALGSFEPSGPGTRWEPQDRPTEPEPSRAPTAWPQIPEQAPAPGPEGGCEAPDGDAQVVATLALGLVSSDPERSICLSRIAAGRAETEGNTFVMGAANYNIGRALEGLGRSNEAYEAYRTSLCLRPVWPRRPQLIVAVREACDRLDLGPCDSTCPGAGDGSTDAVAGVAHDVTETVVAEVLASSAVSDRHPAVHAFDGLPTTAWNEGAPGSGVGEWIEARFSRPVRVAHLTITPGWAWV